MGYIKQFCEKYGYEPEAISYLEEAFQKLEQNNEACEVFSGCVRAYEENYLLEHLPVLATIRKLQESTGIHKYTLVLIYLIELTKHLRTLYEKECIPEEIFDFSVCDLKWKAKECYNVYGVWGSYVGGWTFGFFKLQLFAIGRLQFELRKFPQSINTGHIIIDQGEPYLNVHIPSSGPLDYALCQDSYRKAAAFFQERYSLDRIIFGCHSWLLAPCLTELLPQNSRILTFAQDYTVIEVTQDAQYKHLDKIFSTRELPENRDDLPEDTNLRRTMKKWIKDGNFINIAFGVFSFQ